MSSVSKLKLVFLAHSVIYSLLVVMFAISFSLVTIAVLCVQEQRADCQCQGNLPPLALALDWHRTNYGCLPPPFITDQTGKPLYSWRVLLLESYDFSQLADEFDYTKPWDDPVNTHLAKKGLNEHMLKGRLSCPSVHCAKAGQTHYFYLLDAEDRWPHDFFLDQNSRPKILLVESQWRDVYWSEPVDFVYEKSHIAQNHKSGHGCLEKLRETKPPHPDGFNGITSDMLLLKIPGVSEYESDRRITTLFPHVRKENKSADKERIDQLVAKLTKRLGEVPQKTQRMELLLLGELGPQAASAVPAIRRIIAEGDKSLRPIAALALKKIEKDK